jgi:hypothetical protein
MSTRFGEILRLTEMVRQLAAMAFGPSDVVCLSSEAILGPVDDDGDESGQRLSEAHLVIRSRRRYRAPKLLEMRPGPENLIHCERLFGFKDSSEIRADGGLP